MTRSSVWLSAVVVASLLGCSGTGREEAPRSENPPAVGGEAPASAIPATIGSGDEIGGDGIFDSALVVRAIRDLRGEIERCHREARSRATGRVVVRFTVVPGGAVEGVAVSSESLGDPAALACVTSAIDSMTVPPGPEGGVVEYSFPITIGVVTDTPVARQSAPSGTPPIAGSALASIGSVQVGEPAWGGNAPNWPFDRVTIDGRVYWRNHRHCVYMLEPGPDFEPDVAAAEELMRTVAPNARQRVGEEVFVFSRRGDDARVVLQFDPHVVPPNGTGAWLDRLVAGFTQSGAPPINVTRTGAGSDLTMRAEITAAVPVTMRVIFARPPHAFQNVWPASLFIRGAARATLEPTLTSFAAY